MSFFLLCKNEPESLLHALCDCSLVRRLWLNISSSLSSKFFSNLNLKGWLKKWSNSNLVTSFHSSILWKDVFPIFCWCIWSSSNKVAMEGASFVHHKILKRAKALTIEFFFSLPHKGDHPSKAITLIGCSHFVKLNTDGFVLGSEIRGRQVLEEC